MNNFEIKKEYEKKISTFENNLAKSNEKLLEQQSIIQMLKNNEEKLKNDLKITESRKNELEIEISCHLQEIEQLKFNLSQEKEINSKKIKNFESLIRRKLIFDDEKNEVYNSFNVCKITYNHVSKYLKNY